MSILVLLGCIPGAFLLKNAEARYIKFVFGVVVILIGIEMYLREKEVFRLRESKIILAIIGILSGVLCGLFGVGALLAAYVGRVTGSDSEFKANISAVFIVENTFRIILYSAIGVITFSSLKYSLILFPFMLAGLFAGIKSASILDEKTVKKLVIILLIVSGIMLIIKNL